MGFVSERSFKLWNYNVSHKQLLLRSPQSEDCPDNIDVIFWGVEFIQIPSLLVGIELRQASSADLQAATDSGHNDSLGVIVVRIDSGSDHFFVACAGYKVLRNCLDLFESSLYYFGSNESPSIESLGETLYHS
ncbi:hypothetical protein [Tuwongella immobilis]|uniref:Uncharacterized protein n=1 Tax=Tuwongella immobilis TaxID=692036 RepID=A0A6C2YJU8_9BACT|nr:hypothetical protein [Tuwongella immobilis]VIP01644.1 Uncharacterized protein OS=Candidatus Thiomargarita nelsonii GN=OT06_58015 PE=4 SV=1 [Tuwongella immobilis]VTR99020.1 Uncharacterized protein OS=Candidatus Thiomargarita nelsonii GN=OT06_58015 PE=4 SV=1 [Tuwongella immobilis]